MSGILRLESLTKGNTLKQGDKTPLKYRLFDSDGEALNIAGKSAKVRLVYPDFLTIGYEKGGLTVAQDDTVTFTIDNVIPSRIYHVEIIVDEKFIFPSRADESKFTVDKSSLGTEANIIEIVGVDAVVRKAVDLINVDPSLIIDEDKLVTDIISNTGIGSINDYYQAFNDLKPRAELSISKSAEALTKSQNALNVANGIDAKATNALSLSESADTLSKSVQEQFNQVIIDGDSSVEAAQARVDASGQTNPTLKARLDKEHNEVTAQLAQTAKQTDVNNSLMEKRDKSVPIGLNDASSDLLTAIQGGTTVEVLSIPRDFSVTPKKATFFTFGKNLYNPNDPDILIGKGIRQDTDTIIDAPPYNISGFMSAQAGERIMISSSGQEVPNPAFYKVVSYNSSGDFISTQTYATGGVTLPSNTDKIRVQVDATALSIQIEKGSTATSFEAYKPPTIQEVAMPRFSKSKIYDLEIEPKETTFIVSSKNLFNPNDDNVQIGKGFSGTTGTIVDAPPYNISGSMSVQSGDRIMISNEGSEVSNPTFYKVASYDEYGNFLSTQIYAIGGVTTPANTKQIRVSYDNTANTLQIETGNAVTNYTKFGIYLDSQYLEGKTASPLNGLRFTSFGDSITYRNSWQPHVSSYFELTHTNLGIGSTTLAYVESVEAELPSFTNATRLQAVKDSNPDVLTILGGANDAHRSVVIGDDSEFTKAIADKDKTTFKGAYSYILETLLTWKPALDIILLAPFQANWEYDYDPYWQATKEVANYYALPLIDLKETGIGKYNAVTFTTDGIHPNALGGKRIASLVIDKFNAISHVR